MNLLLFYIYTSNENLVSALIFNKQITTQTHKHTNTLISIIDVYVCELDSNAITKEDYMFH